MLPGNDTRDYVVVAAEIKARGAKTLYDHVAELPEQTWRAAGDGMPPKTSRIYFPLGLDGGRQRFRLDADGTVRFRSKDQYLMPCPGRCFGWVCETLEGAMHLLITRALPANSREVDWILKDYEDNRYLSNQYGYALDDFDAEWFGRGGMSMQACLLQGVEPYLYRDDVKQALRAIFNAEAVSLFPDVRMNTEHALPAMGDWRGDHYKSSDEANAAGWLRYLFVREEDDTLLIGKAVLAAQY